MINSQQRAVCKLIIHTINNHECLVLIKANIKTAIETLNWNLNINKYLLTIEMHLKEQLTITIVRQITTTTIKITIVKITQIRELLKNRSTITNRQNVIHLNKDEVVVWHQMLQEAEETSNNNNHITQTMHLPILTTMMKYRNKWYLLWLSRKMVVGLAAISVLKLFNLLMKWICRNAEDVAEVLINKHTLSMQRFVRKYSNKREKYSIVRHIE